MSATSPDLVLLAPQNVAEATRALARHQGSRPIAGGTDLVPNLRHGLEAPAALVDLAGIAELQALELGPAGLRLGAGVTLARLAEHPGIARDYAALAEAARAIAGPTHRASGTVGGNLCLDTRCLFYNQSQWWRASNGFCLKRGGTVCHVAPTGKRCHAAYSGELAPALLVLDAVAEIAGPAGRRALPLAALYAEDGAGHLTLREGEIVVAVEVPAPAGLRSTYAKARLRGAIDFPLAGVAVALAGTGGRIERLRLALTGTNSRPFLLEGTAALEGGPLDEAALKALDRLVQKQVSPMRTTMLPAHYRRRVAAALARRLATRLRV
jgi:4-hydroxybenzoyl-CoA reductase subunit beta